MAGNLVVWRKSRRLDVMLIVFALTKSALVLIHGGMLVIVDGKIPPFPAMILLGDSTLDVGTNNGLVTVIRSDFDPYGRDLTVKLPKGRFCNGLLTADYLAEEFGFEYQISYSDRAGKEYRLLSGVNFASSGSGWLNLTAETYNVISFGRQIEQFKEYKNELTAMVGSSKAEYIISNALYIISTGANDYLLSYYLFPTLQEKYTITEYQQLIKETSLGYLKELYQIGARNVVLCSTPPIGCLPAAISLYGYRGLGKNGCVESLNKAVSESNLETRQEMIPKFQSEFPDSKLLFFDAEDYIQNIFTHPQDYGFKETRRSCCGTGLVEVAILCNPASPGTCEDANEYLFFDSFHPTTRVYKSLKDILLPLIKSTYNIE